MRNIILVAIFLFFCSSAFAQKVTFRELLKNKPSCIKKTPLDSIYQEGKVEAHTEDLFQAVVIAPFREEMKVYDGDHGLENVFTLGGGFNPINADNAWADSSFMWLQSVSAGYCFSMGGNMHGMVYGIDNFQDIKSETISVLKNKSYLKSIFDWLKTSIKNVWQNDISDRHKAVHLSVLDYMVNFFKDYDVIAAKKWYDADVNTHKFAEVDYLGRKHPARKATATMERLIFKHKVFSVNDAKYWTTIISNYLKNITNGDAFALWK